jgi:hypothetical protein
VVGKIISEAVTLLLYGPRNPSSQAELARDSAGKAKAANGANRSG